MAGGEKGATPRNITQGKRQRGVSGSAQEEGKGALGKRNGQERMTPAEGGWFTELVGVVRAAPCPHH